MKHITRFRGQLPLSTEEANSLLFNQTANLISIPIDDAELVTLVHKMEADNVELRQARDHLEGHVRQTLETEQISENLAVRVEELALEKFFLTKRKTQLEQRLGRSIQIGKTFATRLGGARNEAQEARREAEAALEKAETDSLTGLKNRGAANIIMDQMLEYAKREPTNKITLIFLDIDHFKTINDTYGHAAGDQVLKHLANLLSRHVRVYDLVARYGGEEFVVAMSSNNNLPSLKKAGEICRDIEKTPCLMDDKTSINISASLGVTILDPTTDQTLESAINHADQGMYLSKQLGRNRVSFCPYRTAPTAPQATIAIQANHPTQS